MNVLLNLGENASFGTHLNYVATHNKIFIIDNHLAAFWCWHQLDLSQLLHIDRHYDLMPYYEEKDAFINSIDWSKVNVSDITTYKKEMQGFDYQYIRWDNYIHLFDKLNPTTIDYAVFVTQQEGDLTWSKDYFEKAIWEIFDHIFNEGNKWIFNIDIDYFFTSVNGKAVQMFADSFIDKVGQLLKAESKNAAQLIFCLSPECCGGWAASKKVVNILLKHFNLSI